MNLYRGSNRSEPRRPVWSLDPDHVLWRDRLTLVDQLRPTSLIEHWLPGRGVHRLSQHLGSPNHIGPDHVGDLLRGCLQATGDLSLQRRCLLGDHPADGLLAGTASFGYSLKPLVKLWALLRLLTFVVGPDQRFLG